MVLTGSPRDDRDETRPTGAHWWRYGEHQIVEGTHFAPAEGAEISWYDPFAGHGKFWGPGEDSDGEFRPYADIVTLDADDDGELLEWCRRYGPLGILPQRTVEAFLWPHWRSGVIRGGAEPGEPRSRRTVGEDLGTPYPGQLHYRRGRGTERLKRLGFTRADAEIGEPLDANDLSDALEATDRRLPQSLFEPEVRISHCHDGSTQWASVAEGFGQFFPGRPGASEWTTWRASQAEAEPSPEKIPEDDRARSIGGNLERTLYPLPYEKAFVREYGEPIYLVRRYVKRLQSVHRRWVRAQDAKTVEDIYRALSRARHRPGNPLPGAFEAALHTVHPLPTLDESGAGTPQWKRRWYVPSLYAALHVMMLNDYPLGETVARYCDHCGDFFQTTNHRRQYCTRRCRENAEQARRRERRREEGKSPN